MAMVNEAIARCPDCRLAQIVRSGGSFGERMHRRLEHYRGWKMDDWFWAKWTAELIELYCHEGLCGKHASIFAAHSVMETRRQKPPPFGQPDAILR